MTVTISVGSGKGGTGKSVLVSNLACLLAKAGRRVCLVDLDLGGADAHIMFGLFEPVRTLSDFLARRVERLADVAHTLESFHGLQLIPGSGDTLHSANVTYQEKRRLLTALAGLDTDILIFDVGAGSNYHVLDFFMAADIQICVTCPEPAAILDFYRFLQLATMRKALSSFLSGSEVSATLRRQSFDSLAAVLEHAESIEKGAKERAKRNLEFFNPLMIVNRTGGNARLNLLKMKDLVSRYLGVYLPNLGEIPEDGIVSEALKNYMPVCEYAPRSPASTALQVSATRLGRIVDLYVDKRRGAGAATGA